MSANSFKPVELARSAVVVTHLKNDTRFEFHLKLSEQPSEKWKQFLQAQQYSGISYANPRISFSELELVITCPPERFSETFVGDLKKWIELANDDQAERDGVDLAETARTKKLQQELEEAGHKAENLLFGELCDSPPVTFFCEVRLLTSNAIPNSK